MGRRYVRTFVCEDCGTLTTRMWQARRAKVCLECGKARWLVATEGARSALADHVRACRLELAVQRAVAAHEAPELAPALSALAKGLLLPPGPPQRL